MRVIIASKNPTKINATKEGFKQTFPNQAFEFEGISVPSGVPDQPFGSKETYQGALNRANAIKAKESSADYWVGIEGGNILHGQEMEAMAWIVILSKDKLGKARTAGFFLSPEVVKFVNEGHELGRADEIVFGVENSKQKMGSSGLLTDNLVSRMDLYLPAVIFALIPFKKPELYTFSA